MPPISDVIGPPEQKFGALAPIFGVKSRTRADATMAETAAR